MIVRQLLRASLYAGVFRAWTGEAAETDDAGRVGFFFQEPFGVPESAPGERVLYRNGLGFAGMAGDAAQFVLGERPPAGGPLVGRSVAVFYVGSVDDGASWRRLPFVTRGVIDEPQLFAGQFGFKVVAPTYDAPVETWSSEEHQRAWPGDRFFSQVKALEKGVAGIWWPTVPDFNPHHVYKRQVSRLDKPTSGSPTSNPGAQVVGGVSVALRPAASRPRPGR